MRLLSLGRLAPVFLAGLAVTFVPQVGRAQNEVKKVKFETYDQVEIHGTFYPGKNKDSAPILMVPNIGGTQSQEDWQGLAKTLQAAGHAVLTFDLRGHGTSTTVDENFWKYEVNQRGVKGYNKANPKLSIDRKDFISTYNPMLVNDIAAAKMFIDRRNDAGECNSKKLIVIAAQDGATLASMWLDSEYKRYKVSTYDTLSKVAMKWESTPVGKDTLAMIVLGANGKVGILGVNTFNWFQFLGKNKVPILFLYGDKDPNNSSAYSTKSLAALNNNGKLKEKYMLAKGINTKELGMGLLKGALGADEKFIVPYVNNILEAKGNNDHATSDAEKNGYIWLFPDQPNRAVPAKSENEKCMQFLPVQKYGFQLPTGQ